MKRAFSLILAIIFLLMVSTFGVLSVRYANLAATKTARELLFSQAKIFTLAATERAIFELQRSPCASDFEFFYPDFAAGGAGAGGAISSGAMSGAGATPSGAETSATLVSRVEVKLIGATCVGGALNGRVSGARLITTTTSVALDPPVRLVKITTQIP